jgi:hypothetical protein
VLAIILPVRIKGNNKYILTLHKYYVLFSCMNERLNKLDALLSGAWEQVITSARSKDRATTQTALDRVAHFENLKHQEVALEQSIAASVSNGAPVPTVTPKKDGFLFNPSTRGGKSPTVRPKEVRIGSYRKQIRYANEIPITIANWLTEQSKSIPTLHNFVHPSNSGFAASASTKKLASGQYIEIGDNQPILIQKARKLLDVCGCHGQKFEVLLENGEVIN